MPLTRRELLADTPLWAAQMSSLFLLLSCKKPEAPPASKGMFESEESRTLDAVLALMIPSNVPPGSPGAKEANVRAFIERELQTPLFAGVQRGLRRALIALSETSKRDMGKEFAALDAAGQDLMLTRFQGNTLAFGKNIDTTQAFNHLRSLAFEGFLGDPGSLSWTWLDLRVHKHE